MRMKAITFATILAATSAAIPAYGATDYINITDEVTYEQLDKPTSTYRVGHSGMLTVTGSANIYALINNNYLDGGTDRGTIGGVLSM